MEIVCCLALGDSTVYNFLTPIAQHPSVSKVWIIRDRPTEHGDIPKAEYVIISSRFKLWRFIRMQLACLRLARRKEVRGFVSFNPIPYGMFSFIAAKLFGKSIHLGFIGSDWNIYVKKKWGKWLMPFFKKGDLLTVTGPKMKDEMVARGLDGERIVVLPHCIEMDRFPVAGPEEKKYTCLFAGNLIRLKRVDVILRAFSKVISKHSQAKLCIVGRGPLSDELKSLASELKIDDNVEFTGYVPDVGPYFAASRMIIIASESEGFPFVLVEGMCGGLVPLSTPVGTIEDFLSDGENGLLFPVGDADALADRINRLLEDPQLYERIRANSLKMRQEYSPEKATKVWDQWLISLQENNT